MDRAVRLVAGLVMAVGLVLPAAGETGAAGKEAPPAATGAEMAERHSLADVDDLVALLGLSVKEVVGEFGPPDAVYPVRGKEQWQDDVVFQYPGIDFYLFGNHVWQIMPKKAFNISVGDPKMTVPLVCGDKAIDKGNYYIIEIPGRAWKVEARYSIDARDAISAIYIYRADY
jgi:hypothetical protein